jgi:hypothetical protein
MGRAMCKPPYPGGRRLAQAAPAQLASKREEGRFLSETPNRLHPDGQAVSVQCKGRLAAG